RDAVRRARGEGERPAAARAHRLRRGPGRPARRHARIAGRHASVMEHVPGLRRSADPHGRRTALASSTMACLPSSLAPKGEIIVYPNSALSAWQLAIMALVVVTSLAVWLILV